MSNRRAYIHTRLFKEKTLVKRKLDVSVRDPNKQWNNPVDTGRKLNVHKTFRRRPGRLLNVLCTFNLHPVSIGNIQFWTYYRNEYNWGKSKIRNIYRSNTGYGREQQRSNRNPRQGDSNNVITFRQRNSNHQNNKSEEIVDHRAQKL